MSDEPRVDGTSQEGAAGDGRSGEPTREQLAERMARELAKLPVRDLALQSMATFADMAGIRLGLGPGGEQDRDMAQAKAAIEFLRAMINVAEAEFGAAQARPFREPLAQLQLLYARQAESAAGSSEGASEPKPNPASRLWTPPGSVPGR